MGSAFSQSCCANNADVSGELATGAVKRRDSYVTRRSAFLGQMSSLPDCPVHGCSLTFLQDFAKENREKVPAEDFTIGALCTQVIKPATKQDEKSSILSSLLGDTSLSYAEVAMREGLVDSAGRAAFQDMADHFVSHAWRYSFDVVLNALASWVRSKGTKELRAYFWVDAFVVNQHRAQQYPMEWWSTRFAQAVGDIGSTILVCDQWEDPAPLKRVWVIWEIYCTNQMGARFDMAMAPETTTQFRSALIRSFESVQTALSAVDVANSVAYHREHQDMVHDEITRTIGFTKLNEMVQLRMNRWLIEEAERELKLMKQSSKTEISEEQFKLQDNLARMLRESGNLSGAEAYFKALLQDIENQLGKDSAFAMSCLNQLAVTLQKAKKTDAALQFHRDCLMRRKRILGEHHEDTIQSMSNLAVLLSSRRPLVAADFNEAQSLFRLALQEREKSIGADNPRTLYTLSNLAKCLSEAPESSKALQGEAEESHKRAVTKLVEALQEGHPLSLAALHNQACYWADRTAFEGAGPLAEQALAQLRRVHKLRIEKLGKEHPDTQLTEKKLRELMRHQTSPSDVAQTSTWTELFEMRFEEMNTARLFTKAREELRQFGVNALKQELTDLGWVSDDLLTTGMQPFNFLACIVSGQHNQRKAAEEQLLLGEAAKTYAIVHNKAECDDHWDSKDPSWLGKSSMSKRHRFLLMKELRWEWFNVLTFGLQSGNEQAVQRLISMKEAALTFVRKAKGWPAEERVGLYLAVWPMTSVPLVHMHIVDLDNLGPTFERLSKKMLPVDEAILALKEGA